MIQFLRSLGGQTLDYLASVGRATILWSTALWGLPGKGDVALLLRQIYNVGVLSLLIIVLSAFCIGAVIALQFHTQLARFGAEDNVGLGRGGYLYHGRVKAFGEALRNSGMEF